MTTNTTQSRGHYQGWYVVAACLFIALTTVGARQAFGVFVKPMSDDLGWDRTTISLAVALGVLVNGLTQPFMGYLFDRMGARVITASLIVVGLATASLAFTFHILFLAFMFGVVASTALSGAGLTNTAALLSKWFRNKRSTVVGINSAGVSIGGLLLVPFAAYLIEATNWRVTWIALGMIILALSVPFAFLFLRDNHRNLAPNLDREPDKLPGPLPTGPLETDQWTQPFRSLPFWQMSASFFACGSTTMVIAIHFVAYAEEEVGASPILAAWIFSFMMLLNVAGSIGAGILGDKFRRKDILAAVYLLRGCAYLIMLVTSSTFGLWAFAALAGVSWIATGPLTMSLTADVYGVRALGTISGITFVFHQVGGACAVLLAGVLRDATGSYSLPFAIVGSLLFLAAISAFTIKEHKYSIRFQTQGAAGVGD
jgi:MFS family permease